MKSPTTFQERTKLALEELSKQKPATYEEMKAQVIRIEQQRKSKQKSKK